MADNSNPQGTGTDTTHSEDDGLEAFLADSNQSNQEGEAEQSPDEESPEGEQPEGTEEENTAEQYILLPDGTKKPFAEYEAERMLQSDYTRKTQAHSKLMQEAEAKTARLGEQASLIDAQQKQLELSHAATEDFLASQIPPEPDLMLASTDPAEYWRQKAYYDHALGNLQRFANMRHQQRNEYEHQVEQNRRKFMSLEDQKLEQFYPHIADPAKREAFHDANMKEAAKYGFSKEEYAGSNAAAKRLLARLTFLEAKEKARTTAQPAKQVQPGVAVQGRQQIVTKQAKEVQAFRQSGSATAAKKALDSGAFDHLL